jgi:hypothetical protein
MTIATLPPLSLFFMSLLVCSNSVNCHFSVGLGGGLLDFAGFSVRSPGAVRAVCSSHG